MKNIFFLLLVSGAFLIQNVHAADYRLSGNVKKVAGDDKQNFMQPVWSPDGSRIAFTAPGYRGIWVIDADGTNMMQISDEIGAGFGFDWSPDAQAIALRSALYDGPYRKHAIKIFDFNDKRTYLLGEAQKGRVGLPKWSRDNTAVYFYNNNKLEIMASGKQPVLKKSPLFVYSDTESIFIEDQSADKKLYWSPVEGKEILNLKVSTDGTKVSFEILGGNLFVANLDGTKLQDLGRGHRATWSPGSTHLIYMVTVDNGHEFLESDLYISRIADGERFQLTNTPNKMEMNPSWSPDGKTVVYDEYTEGAIYTVQIIPE